MFRGVWVHVSLPDTRELRLAAAKLLLPDRAVLCELTAAWVHGADVRRVDDLDLHVGFPPGTRIRNQAGLVVCQETLAPSDILVVDGVRVTTPVRTAFDCLRLLRGMERLVVADALTQLQRVTVEEIAAYFAGQRRRRNLRIGAALVDQIEPLSESPMESRLRLVLIAGDLPRPTAQYEVRRADGGFVGRVDLAYPELKIAIEYDGAWHWKQRREDDRRRAALRALGWDVLVYSADDIYGTPDNVVAEVRAARAARGRELAR
ncbi:MAG TPA: DUF559 domain-containing protein [Mycobacteriales bacterium]|nr:DUF559 domain-containing protein [Mycobacteriales bacterium]